MTAVKAIMVETESCVKHLLLVSESKGGTTIIKFFKLVAIAIMYFCYITIPNFNISLYSKYYSIIIIIVLTLKRRDIWRGAASS